MDTMWQEYGIEELEKGMQKLFPTFRISVTDLMTQILHRYQKYIDLVDCTGDSVGIADSFCGSI